jgi:SAM-dependent methyltransferase
LGATWRYLPPMREGQSYDELVSEALAAPFSGWDFSFVEDRIRGDDLPWSYEGMASAEISDSTRLLDLGTGGGETLAEVLAPMLESGRRPAHVVATEAWLPNVPVARERLEPLGITVRQDTSGSPLPADDAEFDLVLNRHGEGPPAELHRVLAPMGVYLSQGVGRRNDVELNAALGAAPPASGGTLDDAVSELQRHDFEIVEAEDAFIEVGFCDIGAVVFHLSAVSWQIPGFDVTTYDGPLRQLDARIRREGPFVVRNHRYMVKAIRR